MAPEDVARRSAAAMLGADAASAAAGVELVEVSPGHARASMTVTPSMLNGHDIAHGAFVFLLADTTFAVACNSYGERTVASGCEIAYLAPARSGDVLVAEAVERVRVGRAGLYDVSVRRANGTPVAELRGHSRTIGGSLVEETDT